MISIFTIYILVVLLGVIALMAAVEIFITLTPSKEARAANKKIKEIRKWVKRDSSS